MGWPFALALLVAGLLIGQVWARGSRRLWGVGSARPGVALGALAALVAALVSGVRGLWPEALALLALAAVLAGVARRRAFFGRAGRSASLSAVRLTRADAAAVLGVAPTASEAEVQAAYRRLMLAVHPDQGGTAGLAAQLNAARDTMLRRPPP